MAVPTSANYVFVPWVRQGAASGIQTPDSLSANQAGVVSVPVKLRINNTDDVDRQVRLYGPGDVTGIDPQQVIRTEPRHLTMEFEPNYFPAIEFDRPDFPWLFTPARADEAGRLRPWLCLVVVRKQEGVMLRTDRNLPLPVLEIKAPARPERELPDLSESWAWAHAQVTGSQREAASLQASLAGDPALTVSRLLCPRRLDPATEYLACLVPAFELGRKAGLDMPIEPADEQKLEPAWASRVQSPSTVGGSTPRSVRQARAELSSRPLCRLLLPIWRRSRSRQDSGCNGSRRFSASLKQPIRRGCRSPCSTLFRLERGSAMGNVC
jgi:hypothetical protein